MTRSVCVLGVFALLFTLPPPSFAVKVSDKAGAVTIKTDMYELTWKKAETMGYDGAMPVGAKKSLINPSDSTFFHGGDYAGWEFWGETDKVKILEENPGKAVVEYTSKNTVFFAYSCIATYWDGVPFFKHEVRGTNISKEARVWPISGYDPMVIPGVPFGVNREQAKTWKEPLPHVAYWTADGYWGLYSANPKAKPKLGDWRGEGDMIQLDHDWQAALLEKKQQSEPIIYYVALAKGGEAEAHALADQVLNALGNEPKAVESVGKIPVLWGALKAIR